MSSQVPQANEIFEAYYGHPVEWELLVPYFTLVHRKTWPMSWAGLLRWTVNILNHWKDYSDECQIQLQELFPWQIEDVRNK